MFRAGLQRYLAAAGLAMVTGAAAIGLAVLGVGPLGEVAASVHGAGAALSRGVLSVVMPAAFESAADEPTSPDEAVPARAAAPARTAAEEGRSEAPDEDAGDEPDDRGTGLPAVGPAAPGGIGVPTADPFDPPSVPSGLTSGPVAPAAESAEPADEPSAAERLFRPVEDLAAGALR